MAAPWIIAILLVISASAIGGVEFIIAALFGALMGVIALWARQAK